jgi:phosphocarrier protein
MTDDGNIPATTESVRRVVVANQFGLHARPAGQVAREAQRFSAAIRIVVDGEAVDAKSILSLLTLAAAKGSVLEIRAAGPDAEDAVACIEALFLRRFGEGK